MKTRRPVRAILAVLLFALSCASLVNGAEAKVGQAPPANTSPPTISGTAAIGSQLTGSTGTWSPSSKIGGVQWHRCDSSGNGCAAIGGATASTYTVATSDVGFTIRFAVTGTNNNSSTTAWSAPTALVAPAPAPAPLHSVSESVVGGSTLSGSVSWTASTSDAPTKVDFSIDGVLKWTEIQAPYVYNGDGNTLDTKTLSNGGHTLSVKASYPDGTTASASASVTVSNAAPAPLHSVSESVVGGSTLSGSVSWTASTSDAPTKVDFSIDGVLKWTEIQAPYVYNGDGNTLDTKTLSNGGHTLSVKASYPDGTTASASASVTVSNTISTSAPTATGILRTGNTYATSTNYNRYDYVIVGRGDAAIAGGLMSKSLVYMSAADINPNLDAGVSYTQASANGWLLKDASGNYLKSAGWGFYVADVGNPAFQQAWVNNVGSFLALNGDDGVFIDTVIADVAALTGGTYPTLYPNQAAWETAMASFVAYVGPALKAKGFYVLANAHKYISGNNGSDDGSLEASWWTRIGPNLSGLMTEYWMQDPTSIGRLRGIGAEWYNHADGWQKLVSVAQSTGADFFGDTYASSTSDIRPMRYGKGTFLLDWDGGGGALFVDLGGADPWNAAWTTNIGAPNGAKFQLQSGVWQRNFSQGYVVVNENVGSVTVTVNGTARTIGGTDALISN
jgi:hypothetical protein